MATKEHSKKRRGPKVSQVGFRPGTQSNEALKALLDGPNTSKRVGVSPVLMQRLEQYRLVEAKDTERREGERGRPALVWKLTPNAKARVKRQVEREARESQTA